MDQSKVRQGDCPVTELLLSTTSVKIGSLPSQGPATVLAGAIVLQATESHKSQ